MRKIRVTSVKNKGAIDVVRNSLGSNEDSRLHSFIRVLSTDATV